MNLSPNFTLTEFTKSQTALRLDIDNTPSPQHLENAKALAVNVLQKVREHFGPTTINSGYRGPELNQAVGGVPTSQHCLGEAADIEIPGVPNADIAMWIADNCDFDQCILEFYTPGIPDSGWVHVSYKRDGSNRRRTLTAVKVAGRTEYRPGLQA